MDMTGQIETTTVTLPVIGGRRLITVFPEAVEYDPVADDLAMARICLRGREGETTVIAYLNETEARVLRDQLTRWLVLGGEA